MTPAEAALSSLRPATAARRRASSALPASAASRNLRTADLSADFTDLLRSCAASFCRLRLIWDLMFATGQASIGSVFVGLGFAADRRATHATAHIISAAACASNRAVPQVQPRRCASQDQVTSAYQDWCTRNQGEECGAGSSRRARK